MAAASNDDDGMISGINVTPLVDITLVLLIVFMVTAKIIVSSALPLDLPSAAKGGEVQMVFSLEMHANGDVVVNNERVGDDSQILGLAKEHLAKNPALRAVIRADKTVQHGRIIRMLDLLKQAGITKIAFGVAPIPAEPGAVGPQPAPEAPAAPAPEGK